MSKSLEFISHLLEPSDCTWIIKVCSIILDLKPMKALHLKRPSEVFKVCL